MASTDDVNSTLKNAATGLGGEIAVINSISAAINYGIINVMSYGAVGDGVTDDAAAINAASAAAVKVGATTVWFPSGKTFYIKSSLLPRQNLIWEGNGSTITTDQNFPVLNLGMFHNVAQTNPVTRLFIGDVTADIAGPTNQLTLTSTTGLNIGDTIGMRLGVDPWDNPETRFCMICKVTNIAGSTITLDRWIPYKLFITSTYTYVPKNGTAPIFVPAPIAGSSAANDQGNKSIYKFTGTDLAQNLVFRDFVFTAKGSGAIGGAIYIQWGQNIIIENVVGNPNGTGDLGNFITLQFCQDCKIRNCSVYSISNPANSPSQGTAVGLAEARNIIVDNLFSMNLNGNITFICEAFCENVVLSNSYSIVDGFNANFKFGIGAGGGSTMTVHNHSVLYKGPHPDPNGNHQFFPTIGQDGNTYVTGVFTWRGPMPFSIVTDTSTLHCVFDYENGPDGYVQLDFMNRDRQAVKIPLFPSMISTPFQVLSSVPTQIDLFTSANVDPTTVTGLTFWFESGAPNHSGKLIPGEVVNICGIPGLNFQIGDAFGGFAALNGTLAGAGQIQVFTNSNAQPTGNFLGVAVESARVLETGPPFTATVTLQSPSAIFGANLIAWYKANVGVTGTNPITKWADQSGNGHDLTVAFGAPFLIAAGLNGNPAINFVASTDGLQSSAFNVNSNVAGFFMVGRFAVTAPPAGSPRVLSYFIPGSGNDFNTAAAILPFDVPSPGNLTAFQNSVEATVTTMAPGGVWIGFSYNGPGGTVIQYINNTTPVSSSGFGNNTLGAASSALCVGYNAAGPSISMIVTEVIMVNVAPTPTQISAIANYFTQTWSLVPSSLGNNRTYPIFDGGMDDLLTGQRTPYSGGTFVANGATPVSVTNANVQITDVIVFSLNTVGGTVGAIPTVKTITAGTGFTVAGTASDTSTYNYILVRNA